MLLSVQCLRAVSSCLTFTTSESVVVSLIGFFSTLTKVSYIRCSEFLDIWSIERVSKMSDVHVGLMGDSFSESCS